LHPGPPVTNAQDLEPGRPELTNFSPRVSSAWVGPAKLAPGGALRQGTLGNGMAYLRLGTGPPLVFLPGLSSHR